MNPFALGEPSQVNVDTTAIILTAYTIYSAYLSEEVCVTASEVPITVKTAYTIASPTTLPSSEVRIFADTKFVEMLGISDYITPINQATNISVTPTPLAPLRVDATSTISPTSPPLRSSNTTTSSTLHFSNATEPTATPGLDEPERIGIGVAVSFAALILVSLVAVIWRERKAQSAAIAAEEQRSTQDRQEGKSANRSDVQPYLQQKPELEAEEQQIYELDAWQEMCELDGENGINEISAGTYEHRLAVMQTRQELEGGKHSQEVDS